MEGGVGEGGYVLVCRWIRVCVCVCVCVCAWVSTTCTSTAQRPKNPTTQPKMEKKKKKNNNKQKNYKKKWQPTTATKPKLKPALFCFTDQIKQIIIHNIKNTTLDSSFFFFFLFRFWWLVWWRWPVLSSLVPHWRFLVGWLACWLVSDAGFILFPQLSSQPLCS